MTCHPIGKILDLVLGHNEALFRRAQLKALVSIHGQEASKVGEFTHDETTNVSGALGLTEKTVEELSRIVGFSVEAKHWSCPSKLRIQYPE
uniref:CNNM transmembrane domain-containing protein n=1 Tax=Vitis vinifera TaxID=29760 RepID=F6GX30_VITVI